LIELFETKESFLELLSFNLYEHKVDQDSSFIASAFAFT